jgi:hypothetical protein
MPASHYIINELFDTKDNRYWKLHWFEHLAMNQATREPLIAARFVPLVRDDLDVDANPPELLDNASYGFNESKLIEVGGGQLPILSMGLLLHQGRPVKRPCYQTKVFDLYIGYGTTTVLPVGPLPGNGRDKGVCRIPWDEYQLQGTNPFTMCLHINVNAIRPDRITKIIIPWAELIRHHYGNSSELFREVLTDGLSGDPNRVFNPSRTVMPGNGAIPHLELTKYVKDEDAPIVARFAFSRYAFASGRRIFLSAFNNYRHGRGGYMPEVVLPYVDMRTKLIVHGKTIRVGKSNHFLVFYIEKDYAQFPFEYFKYGRDDGGIRIVEKRIVPGSGSRKKKEKDDALVTVQDEVEEQIIRSDKEPSPAKEQVEEILLSDKFPDLLNKRWDKQQRTGSRTQPNGKQVGFIQGHDDTEDFSTAPVGGGNSKVTPLSLIPEHESGEGVITDEPSPFDEGEPPTDLLPPDSVPDRDEPRPANRLRCIRASDRLFLSLVDRLNKVKPSALSCEMVELPEHGPLIREPYVSEFPTEWEDEQLPWSKVFRDGEWRARRVMVAEGCCHDDRYFYLLEIEPPESEEDDTYTMLVVHSSDSTFSALEGEDLQEVLARCAINEGTWFKEKDEKELQQHLGWRKLKHASKVYRRYVFRVVDYLYKAGMLRLTKAEHAWLDKQSKVYRTRKASSTGEAIEERVDESSEDESDELVLDREPSQVKETKEAAQTDESTETAGTSETVETSEASESPQTEDME